MCASKYFSRDPDCNPPANEIVINSASLLLNMIRDTAWFEKTVSQGLDLGSIYSVYRGFRDDNILAK